MLQIILFHPKFPRSLLGMPGTIIPPPPPPQCAKKAVSDSPGLVDCAIGLANSVFNLPDRQVMFFAKFE